MIIQEIELKDHSLLTVQGITTCATLVQQQTRVNYTLRMSASVKQALEW